MARLIIAAISAIILSVVEIIVVIALYVHHAEKIPTEYGRTIKIAAAFICLSLIAGTWAMLIGKNNDILKSTVDINLIAALTEEKLEHNLPLLFKSSSVSGYRNNVGSSGFSSHGMTYVRRSSVAGTTRGLVSISIRIYSDEADAKRSAVSLEF